MLCSLLHDRVAGRHILLFRSTASQDFAMGFSYNVKEKKKCTAQKNRNMLLCVIKHQKQVDKFCHCWLQCMKTTVENEYGYVSVCINLS